MQGRQPGLPMVDVWMNELFLRATPASTFSMESRSPVLHQMLFQYGNLKPHRLLVITVAF